MNSSERSREFSLYFQLFTLLRTYPLLRELYVHSAATLWFHYSGFQAVFTKPLPSKWTYSSEYHLL
jgi:hypothetical protein